MSEPVSPLSSPVPELRTTVTLSTPAEGASPFIIVARGGAGDHFSMADAFEVTVPGLLGCKPGDVVRLLEVGCFGGSHLDVEGTFRVHHVHLLLGRNTQRETHHRRCHCKSHPHIVPEMQLIEFLIRARP